MAKNQILSKLPLVAIAAFGFVHVSSAQTLPTVGQVADQVETQVTNQTLNSLFSQAQGSIQNMLQSGVQSAIGIPNLDLSPSISQSENINQYASISAGLGYIYHVAPAYISGQFQRVDGYQISNGFGANSLIGVTASLQADIQVSFSRLFPTKIDALAAIPISPTMLPLKAQDFLQNLKIGEAARVEIASSGTIGIGANSLLTPLNVDLYANVSRGTRFTVDVFKISDHTARVRFVVARNMADLAIGSSVNPLRGIDLGLGLLDQAASQLISCVPASIGYKQNVSPNTPVDIMSVDYLLDFNQPDAVAAYESILGAVVQLQPDIQISFLQSASEFEKVLDSSALPLDTAFQQSKLAGNGAIDRVLKTHIMTQLSELDLGSNCMMMWNASDQKLTNTSLIRVFDGNDKTQDFFMLGSDENTTSAVLFNQIHSVDNSSVRVLYSGVRKDESDPLSLVPQSLREIRFHNNTEYKTLGSADTVKLKNRALYEYPTLGPQLVSQLHPQPAVQATNMAGNSISNAATNSITDAANNSRVNTAPSPPSNSTNSIQFTNVFLQSDVAFNPDALALLPAGLTEGDIRSALITYLSGYPDIDSLHADPGALPSSRDDSSTSDLGALARFDGDIARITISLQRILDPDQTGPQQVVEISHLRRVPLFHDIGGSFLMSLIPAPQLATAPLSMSLKAGANDKQKIEITSVAKPQMSMVQKIGHVIDIVNSRSYDIRPSEDMSQF